ncbi:MAG: lipid A biosynthesis lauroyl acyltransferase [Proteobacteria bacterium]|nr:lipid A biosynthesis lauroyl acyltransferase [Pseudomonadota bacterium]
MTGTQGPFLRRLRYALEAVPVYILYLFFRVLPMETASTCGGAVCRLIGPHLPSSTVARRNLALTFPDKQEAEREKIVVGMWDNLGRVVAEYAHLPRIWQCMEVVGAEHLAEVRDSGKPAIFFSAHLANWEVGPVTARKMGLDTYSVYRRPNNMWVDGLLHYARRSVTAGLIAKGASGAREMLALLKNNKALVILMDQKLNEGMSIPFFGRNAMTATAIASFALWFDCPVYPGRVERLGGCRFRLTIYPALDISRSGDKEADIRQILTTINRQLEDWIRERPEQWLWIHHRWPD